MRQLFSYPFRIFFIAVATWAVLVIPLWLGIVTGNLNLPLALPSLNWHQHEMLFGLINPAIAGFLLTAVCVWTQTDRLHGAKLMALSILWLLGRLTMLFGEMLPMNLASIVNLLFLPCVMLDAGWRICKARQMNQLILIVALGLLWLMELGFFIQPSGVFIHGGFIMAMTLMLIVGGRITPAFSRNWLRQQYGNSEIIRTYPWLEKFMIGTMLLLLVAVLMNNNVIISVLAFIAALICFIRFWNWRGWLVRREPLLWILHLSLLWIPLGLVLLAGSAAGWWPVGVWIHAIGIGAIGGLILGVMTRVSLGHTGRALKLPHGIVAAYFLIHCGAVLRILTALMLLPWKLGLVLSASCWLIAFGIFLWRYLPILTSPRVDDMAK